MSEPEWERLRALFEGALERAPNQRAAFLHERVGSDASLRREVESLLAAHGAAASFLPESHFDRPDRPDDPDGDVVQPPPPRLAPGTRLGAFELLEIIGAGGMGEVYRA